MESDGGTALGPALYASVLIAARKSGSKVFLFTDGVANLGVGALDDRAKMDDSRKFYEDVALLAKKYGYYFSSNIILFAYY